jgi:hypothetical protein
MRDAQKGPVEERQRQTRFCDEVVDTPERPHAFGRNRFIVETLRHVGFFQRTGGWSPTRAVCVVA